MDRSYLERLIQGGESSILELKKSTAEKERACRTICAFANGQGGQLVFGVTPSGKLVGQNISDRTLEELAREFQQFEPPIFPVIERVKLNDNLECLVVFVDHAQRAPVTYRGVPYEKILNITSTMSMACYHQLIIEGLHAHERWENRAASGWDISMLDHREIILTIEEAIRRGRCEDPGTREITEVLRGLGLLVEGDQLSRAAVVLFCKEGPPLPDFSQLKLRLAHFKGNDRDEFIDNKQFNGNAFELMRKAERFLIEILPIAGRILPDRMEREDTPLIPIEALREALANAFVHRDYS
ncbi:MAG: RNA-binding domain-containing protein, partial [Candidatus Margulisiibacteriota bacterium]